METTKMKESDSKLEDTLKPFQSDGIKDYEDMEVDEDVSSENCANKVNDTHTFKNSLVVSKGSTKRGFKIEDLPELDCSNSTKEIRCISFKMEMLQKDKISLYPVQEENSCYSSRYRVRSLDIRRKSSSEILQVLQNKLNELKKKNTNYQLCDFSFNNLKAEANNQ